MVALVVVVVTALVVVAVAAVQVLVVVFVLPLVVFCVTIGGGNGANHFCLSSARQTRRFHSEDTTG